MDVITIESEAYRELVNKINTIAKFVTDIKAREEGKEDDEDSGYITLNKENGKLDFIFPKAYKDALAAGKVVPDDRHKTQVAVNSEGKTNEATKNVKEPLTKGQTQPTEKQADKQWNRSCPVF